MGVEQSQKPIPNSLASQYKEQHIEYDLKKIESLLDQKLEKIIQLDFH